MSPQDRLVIITPSQIRARTLAALLTEPERWTLRTETEPDRWLPEAGERPVFDLACGEKAAKRLVQGVRERLVGPGLLLGEGWQLEGELAALTGPDLVFLPLPIRPEPLMNTVREMMDRAEPEMAGKPDRNDKSHDSRDTGPEVGSEPAPVADGDNPPGPERTAAPDETSGLTVEEAVDRVVNRMEMLLGETDD